MKIALCQINTIIGGFVHNVDKVADFLSRAGKAGAQLAVFPELTICSYAPLDLVERNDFIDAHDAALSRLRDLLEQETSFPEIVVVGGLQRNSNPVGRPLHNSAYVFQRGKLLGVYAKRLLPTYDVFDEARYFQPGAEPCILKVTLKTGESFQLGVSICEDAWFEQETSGRKLYANDPASDLRGADLVVNLSASPYEKNKRERRIAELSSFTKRVGSPVVYVNQVGANDEILFDGASLVFDENGERVFEAPAWREALEFVNLDSKTSTVSGSHLASKRENIDLLYEGLVVGIRDYFFKSGFSKAVIGLSGGIDSAVVACLAADALGSKNVLGVSLPGPYSSPHSLSDAEALASKLGLEYRVHSIKFLNSTLLMELKPSFAGLPSDVTEENVQSRLRGIVLMALANKRRALLLATGNKSELSVGYCTTYGDMAGAIAPIGDVYKTTVYELARFINEGRGEIIPESTLTKAPSAELRPNQTDQDSLPAYDVLDKILESYFEGGESADALKQYGFEASVVHKILDLVKLSEFKRRQAAPVLKVTSKAFGLGRRIPIVRRF